mmetsp:Transcript_7890/g.23794  ORF Transcript_7890/g.23794 Transcript_7890/m.23794 type:complete len:487 (+) Transcript_7890:526-1986(+)
MGDATTCSRASPMLCLAWVTSSMSTSTRWARWHTSALASWAAHRCFAAATATTTSRSTMTLTSGARSCMPRSTRGLTSSARSTRMHTELCLMHPGCRHTRSRCCQRAPRRGPRLRAVAVAWTATTRLWSPSPPCASCTRPAPTAHVCIARLTSAVQACDTRRATTLRCMRKTRQCSSSGRPRCCMPTSPMLSSCRCRQSTRRPPWGCTTRRQQRRCRCALHYLTLRTCARARTGTHCWRLLRRRPTPTRPSDCARWQAARMRTASTLARRSAACSRSWRTSRRLCPASARFSAPCRRACSRGSTRSRHRPSSTPAACTSHARSCGRSCPPAACTRASRRRGCSAAAMRCPRKCPRSSDTRISGCPRRPPHLSSWWGPARGSRRSEASSRSVLRCRRVVSCLDRRCSSLGVAGGRLTIYTRMSCRLHWRGACCRRCMSHSAGTAPKKTMCSTIWSVKRLHCGTCSQPAHASMCAATQSTWPKTCTAR